MVAVYGVGIYELSDEGPAYSRKVGRDNLGNNFWHADLQLVILSLTPFIFQCCSNHVTGIRFVDFMA
jgi:hypothetical protein